MNSGWMKNAVIQANKPKQSIIAVLRTNLSNMAEDRDRSTLHASDVTKPGFCPRKWALLDLSGKDKTQQFVSTALQATFDVGNATARLVIEKWAGEASVGNWECLKCGSQRTMTTQPKNGCGVSQACLWVYREVVVQDSEYLISGSIDCLFDVGVPKLLVTELKIINPEDFEKILAPLPEHRLRTSLYLKIIAGSNNAYKDRFNLHEARVLYVSRAYGKKNPEWNEVLPFKEFVVPRDDEALKPQLKRAKQLRVFRENKLMPSGICATAFDKHATTCSVCKHCFSGDFPAQQEPL